MLTQCAAGVVLFAHLALFAQDEVDYKAYTESPRLLLNSRRLRLLKRERERESMRWQQFHVLMAGKAAMPEPGFAGALYSIVSGDPTTCRTAASGPLDPRQSALVYDWCRDHLPSATRQQLESRLRRALASPIGGILDARNRAFAALATADLDPAASEQSLRGLVELWWNPKIAPVLKTGRQPFSSRESLYALVELLHVLRDNIRVELRDTAPAWFEQLPALQMLTCYPASWPAAENDYRIPAYTKPGDPDLREAALGRATDLALVSYDTNAQPQQFLQGWVILDRFLLRGPFGIPYEFLWANPYQPGLSFYYMPDLYHFHGRLLVRSSWDEDASWFGFWDGQAQAFEKGARLAVNLKSQPAPFRVGTTQILFAPGGLRFTGGISPADEEDRRAQEEFAFVLGLKAGQKYDVEVDGEEMVEVRADEGGIIALKFTRGRRSGVRIKEARPL
jgi:hypothetical protein